MAPPCEAVSSRPRSVPSRKVQALVLQMSPAPFPLAPAPSLFPPWAPGLLRPRPGVDSLESQPGTKRVPRDSHRVKRTLEVKNQTYLTSTVSLGFLIWKWEARDHLHMGCTHSREIRREERRRGCQDPGLSWQVLMAGLGELRLWRASECLCPTAPASEPRPLPTTQPKPPGRGPAKAEGAQAEPEQSSAGRQWEGPGQPGGNGQA